MFYRRIGPVLLLLLATCSAHAQTTLTVATVNNGDMILMQKLSREFESQNPGIRLNWVTLEENVLRSRLTTDIAAGGGQFDVMTIGNYEAPIWGKRGWLVQVDRSLPPEYDLDDILKPVRDGLSSDGKLFALPFYGESSLTFYRKDLFDKAGIKMPEQPTWDDLARFAQALHSPGNGIYGICLRGKPGWGENTALVSTIVNTFGGRWFDERWMPQLNSPEWHSAVSFYVSLLRNYGPPGSSSNGHNETRALFASGKCAIWVDASIAASYMFDRNESRVAGKVEFARAPIKAVTNGAQWLWVWALAIPSSSRNATQAARFVQWATSKDYVKLVARTQGWASAPSGTRKSTYQNAEYTRAAPFAGATLKAILGADPNHPTARPVPYSGIQFVAIPEFQSIGTQVGQSISAALSGGISVDQALQSAQSATERTMRRSGYLK